MYSNIEAERARKHWTIAQCAEKLGIAEKTYRTRLAKGADISCSDLVKFTEIFECSADYLLGLSDKIKIS
jgi:transcriptional regulator with XRE-family HTH domain